MTAKPTEEESGVYNLLIEAAKSKEPCPSNDEMSAILCVNPRTIVERMRRLRSKRLISVVRRRGKYRVVHILQLGITTGESLDETKAPGAGANHIASPDMNAEAREASDKLLRRHLITGNHWITDPARFQAACESVGLAA